MGECALDRRSGEAGRQLGDNADAFLALAGGHASGDKEGAGKQEAGGYGPEAKITFAVPE